MCSRQQCWQTSLKASGLCVAGCAWRALSLVAACCMLQHTVSSLHCQFVNHMPVGNIQAHRYAWTPAPQNKTGIRKRISGMCCSRPRKSVYISSPHLLRPHPLRLQTQRFSMLPNTWRQIMLSAVKITGRLLSSSHGNHDRGTPQKRNFYPSSPCMNGELMSCRRCKTQQDHQHRLRRPLPPLPSQQSAAGRLKHHALFRRAVLCAVLFLPAPLIYPARVQTRH